MEKLRDNVSSYSLDTSPVVSCDRNLERVTNCIRIAKSIHFAPCAVCLDDNMHCLTLVCAHIMCVPCVMKLSDSGTLKCPYCRRTSGMLSEKALCYIDACTHLPRRPMS